MSVHLFVFGSYIESWRGDSFSGATFDDGSEPSLQYAGCAAGGRMRDVNHTRPSRSIIGLWMLVWPSHGGSSTFSSMACGRSCGSSGSSPPEVRSVQSAKRLNAASRPMCPDPVAMLGMACPDCVRRAHRWNELPDSWNSFGTVRMPLLPSAWHDWQAFLTVSTHCSCVFMFSLMPFPLSPVPGNSLLSGILSSEYQYMPG